MKDPVWKLLKQLVVDTARQQAANFWYIMRASQWTLWDGPALGILKTLYKQAPNLPQVLPNLHSAGIFAVCAVLHCPVRLLVPLSLCWSCCHCSAPSLASLTALGGTSPERDTAQLMQICPITLCEPAQVVVTPSLCFL